MPTGNKDIHVTKKGDQWQVKKEGASRAGSSHDTQKEAWDQARSTARKEGTEAYLHDRKGRIRERNTYRKDPYPPPG